MSASLEEALAAARKRNHDTANCNGRVDCRASAHLCVCLSLGKGRRS